MPANDSDKGAAAAALAPPGPPAGGYPLDEGCGGRACARVAGLAAAGRRVGGGLALRLALLADGAACPGAAAAADVPLRLLPAELRVAAGPPRPGWPAAVAVGDALEPSPAAELLAADGARAAGPAAADGLRVAAALFDAAGAPLGPGALAGEAERAAGGDGAAAFPRLAPAGVVGAGLRLRFFARWGACAPPPAAAGGGPSACAAPCCAEGQPFDVAPAALLLAPAAAPACVAAGGPLPAFRAAFADALGAAPALAYPPGSAGPPNVTVALRQRGLRRDAHLFPGPGGAARPADAARGGANFAGLRVLDAAGAGFALRFRVRGAAAANETPPFDVLPAALAPPPATALPARVRHGEALPQTPGQIGHLVKPLSNASQQASTVPIATASLSRPHRQVAQPSCVLVPQRPEIGHHWCRVGCLCFSQ